MRRAQQLLYHQHQQMDQFGVPLGLRLPGTSGYTFQGTQGYRGSGRYYATGMHSSDLCESWSSSNTPPHLRSYEDLLHQVGRLLWENETDLRPIQILYAYFVAVGTEKMEQTLQDLGHLLMRDYLLPFTHTQMLLNMCVKRLAALGRMRVMHYQRFASSSVG
jgi:hypothetical protein